MRRTTTIPLTYETRDRVKERKTGGETYDETIRRLLEADGGDE